MRIFPKSSGGGRRTLRLDRPRSLLNLGAATESFLKGGFGGEVTVRGQTVGELKKKCIAISARRRLGGAGLNGGRAL